MSTTTRIPQEVFDDIFKHLEHNELLSVASTCKKWYTAFRHHFYAHVSLNDLHMLQDFVSTLIKDPSLGVFVRTVTIRSPTQIDQFDQNAYYDTLVALVQQTPFIESIRAHDSIISLFWDILRNTCYAGHWDYLKNLKVKRLDNTVAFDYDYVFPSEPFYKHTRTDSSSDEEPVIGDPSYRPEVNGIDCIINQYSEASILMLRVYRLTDWNKTIDQVNPCLNITQLIVDTPWVTDALLQYICKKFVNVQYLQLVQHINNLKKCHHIPAETFKRFASYLDHISSFKIAFFRLKSNVYLVECFQANLNTKKTVVRTSYIGYTLHLVRPAGVGRVQIGSYYIST
ncbi:hypothetical protein EDC96DRAFT_504826 [Choanephora cucurbitarum]|nr:hypothetical protein EDC96DRAFT_504826 [Choanephora cucurbitarum]